ncbi:hypothetical protein SISNIDRAFT_449609 [Sistotremastrum niveocremeum HHB9708]|uniref:DUF2423 domain-containing protein n=2 Tax=Sistotremastraceae TaxID=3402574 RepID=A0A164ZRS5_9AGAM|nr:hypothetical protein SISNIDRAFT_449609 [Sistotremastrum niveocremeum HHB9708]KZT32129.1 hypothetical protein SISSUDRAFT_1055957 [Sistotremastrum suecicum HHB10207 ss-3]
MSLNAASHQTDYLLEYLRQPSQFNSQIGAEFQLRPIFSTSSPPTTMAKSTRSKTKRAFRRTKREEGIFAATHAARLQRLHSKLSAIASTDIDGDQPIPDVDAQTEDRVEDDQNAVDGEAVTDGMEVESSSAPQPKISTHGPRTSRRVQWRLSKGLPARSKSHQNVNRQGSIPARRKAGRSHRRR